MSKIISIAQQKGGSGKSLISSLIAADLFKMNYKVCLLDADDQGSLYYKRQEQLTGDNIDKDMYDILQAYKVEDVALFVRDKADDYDFVIIDTKGEASANNIDFLCMSDVIIIPVCEGDTDWISLQTFLESTISPIQEKPIKINILPLFNKFENTDVWREFIKDAKDLFFEYNIPVACVEDFPLWILHNYRTYKRIDTVGHILDRKPLRPEVREELKTFRNILKTLLCQDRE